eukprot:10954443-Heterocapsa_arctica.AAC.1
MCIRDSARRSEGLCGAARAGEPASAGRRPGAARTVLGVLDGLKATSAGAHGSLRSGRLVQG